MAMLARVVVIARIVNSCVRATASPLQAHLIQRRTRFWDGKKSQKQTDVRAHVEDVMSKITNEGILERNYPEVLLVGSGHSHGKMSPSEAFNVAEESGMDLILVNDKISPPVVRLMKAAELLKKRTKKALGQTTVDRAAKEVRISSTISEHDLQVKVVKMRRLLEKGSKVTVAVVFKVRREFDAELSRAVLNNIQARLVDLIEEKRTIISTTHEGNLGGMFIPNMKVVKERMRLSLTEKSVSQKAIDELVAVQIKHRELTSGGGLNGEKEDEEDEPLNGETVELKEEKLDEKKKSKKLLLKKNGEVEEKSNRNQVKGKKGDVVNAKRKDSDEVAEDESKSKSSSSAEEEEELEDNDNEEEEEEEDDEWMEDDDDDDDGGVPDEYHPPIPNVPIAYKKEQRGKQVEMMSGKIDLSEKLKSPLQLKPGTDVKIPAIRVKSPPQIEMKAPDFVKKESALTQKGETKVESSLKPIVGLNSQEPLQQIAIKSSTVSTAAIPSRLAALESKLLAGRSRASIIAEASSKFSSASVTKSEQTPPEKPKTYGRFFTNALRSEALKPDLNQLGRQKPSFDVDSDVASLQKKVFNAPNSYSNREQPSSGHSAASNPRQNAQNNNPNQQKQQFNHHTGMNRYGDSYRFEQGHQSKNSQPQKPGKNGQLAEVLQRSVKGDQKEGAGDTKIDWETLFSKDKKKEH